MAEATGNIFQVGQPLLGPDIVNVRAVNRSVEVYDALSLLYYSMLDRVRDLVFNYLVYWMRDAYSELGKFQFLTGRLPLMISVLLDSVNKTLNIVWSRPSQPEVTRTDENWNFLKKRDLQLTLALTVGISHRCSQYADGWSQNWV